jgi:hypothetical protein
VEATVAARAISEVNCPMSLLNQHSPIAAQAQSNKVRFLVTGCYKTYIKATVIQLDTAWQ